MLIDKFRHIVCTLLCGLILLSGCMNPEVSVAQTSVGVHADPLEERVPLSSFNGLSESQIWHQIDGLPYWAIPLEPPEDYYLDIGQTNQQTLRESLHEIIDDHRVFSYTHNTTPNDDNHRVDTWDIIVLADAHPISPSQVLDIYLNDTFARQYRGTTIDPRYDREHSWPKSLGFPDMTTRNPAYSDCHHLFAAYSSYNGSRSNKPYGEREMDAERRRTTIENLNRGGSLTNEPYTSNYSFSDVWQTWIGRRGDVARAMFYMDVRYEGDTHDGTGEPNLVLTDTIENISQRDVWETGGQAYMGLLSVLLRWHQQDPVDDMERRRNTIVYLFQGNRNPFIDHPEWVSTVFGAGGQETNGGIAWINEFHYDNQGADSGEFVEIAGTAGLDLTSWQLIGYNGNGGRTYSTIALSGNIPDMGRGFGVLSFDFPQLQNGAPDGIALIHSSGRLIQFLSYEGGFTATDNAAEGVVSNQIGVSENSGTPSGHSLQLTGRGRQYNDFQWQQPSQSTRGAINTGQVFVSSE